MFIVVAACTVLGVVAASCGVLELAIIVVVTMVVFSCVVAVALMESVEGWEDGVWCDDDVGAVDCF